MFSISTDIASDYFVTCVYGAAGVLAQRRFSGQSVPGRDVLHCVPSRVMMKHDLVLDGEPKQPHLSTHAAENISARASALTPVLGNTREALSLSILQKHFRFADI